MGHAFLESATELQRGASAEGSADKNELGVVALGDVPGGIGRGGDQTGGDPGLLGEDCAEASLNEFVLVDDEDALQLAAVFRDHPKRPAGLFCNAGLGDADAGFRCQQSHGSVSS
jgi:hypothetical protein